MDNNQAQRVQITPIAEEHIEGFHACLDAVCRERQYLGMVLGPPLAGTRDFCRFNIEHAVPQYVALDDGVVVGWCDITPNRREGFRHCGELGMGVRRDHRRQGIGKRLMIQTIARAREIGLERVELQVFASNRAALALYEKQGFAIEGIKKRARKLDGAYDNVVCMALFLDQDQPGEATH
jgi:RimJ/RimL family protein N-acetyltransferase